MALVLVIVTVLLGSAYMIRGVSGVFHDDAIYVSTAQALAEGQGYRLINLPEEPRQTKYPPLYPALLALVWKLYPTFPNNLILMQWLTLLCGGGMLGLCYLYLVRFGYFSRTIAAAAVALTQTSAFFMYFCTVTLSEMSFGLLSIVALWFLERQDEGQSLTPVGQFFLGVLLSLPFLTRTIGILLIPLGFYILWRKGRPLGWVGLGATVSLAPWLFWMLVLPRWAATDTVTVYYTNYLTWWVTNVKPAILQVISINFSYLMTGTALIALGFLNSGLLMPPWGWALKFVLGIITWFYIAGDLPKGRVLPVFLVANFLIILVWPWSPLRFLIPILPFLLAYLLFGLWKLLNKMPLYFYVRRLALVALAVVLAINVLLFVRLNNQNHDKYYPFWYQNKELGSWASYQEVFTWLKKNSRPNDVIASGLDSMIFLYTDRQAFRPFQGRPTSLFYGQPAPALGSWEEVSGLMERHKARYFVQMPMPGFSEEKPLVAVIQEIQKRRPGWLKPVYVGPDNRFTIFAIGSNTEPSHSHLE